MKEHMMIEDLQKDTEEENKLQDEIEVCVRNSLSVFIRNEIEKCMLYFHVRVPKCHISHPVPPLCCQMS
jgi:hypothetical protein